MEVSPLIVTFSLLLWFSIAVEEFCSARKLRRRYLVKENEILSRYPGQDDYISPTAHVQAVEGGDAILPCDLQSSIPNDHALLVLWYRKVAAKPIYSYDVRHGAPQHWKDVILLGDRATFDPVRGALVILKTATSDADSYKCRVDFKIHQTLSYVVNLTVIVPPRKIWIVAPTKIGNRSLLGPYLEGDTLKLRCESVGGIPSPEVSWWDKSTLIDNESEVSSKQQVSNELNIESLRRDDLNRIITCKANNSLLIQPLQTSVIIDMIFGPKEVQILSAKEALSAGRVYEVTCQSRGSKPSAQIRWHIQSNTRNNFVIKNIIEGTITSSRLQFTPQEDDNGLELRCIAIVPSMPEMPVMDTWRLNVYFPPKVSIRLGSFLDPDNIKEGDSLYFECIIKANPPMYKIIWYHQQQELRPDRSRGVIVSNLTLVIQNVKTTSSGIYSCKVSNIEGDGVATPLEVAVKYAPVCTETQGFFFGVAPNEEIHIPCSVRAYPEVVSFIWLFNSSGESLKISKNMVRSRQLESTIRYTPRTEMDYGTLLCFATNAVGKQRTACLFHIFPAGRPDPVFNCSQFNLSEYSVNIRCNPGFDGGIPQSFILEIYEPAKNRLIRNVTYQDTNFRLNRLPSGDVFDVLVYPVNSKGIGEKLKFKAYTLKDNAGKRTAAIKPAPSSKQEFLSMLLAPMIVAGILIILLLTGIAVFSIFRFRRSKRNIQGKETHKMTSGASPKGLYESSSLIGTGNPDIIPIKGDLMLTSKDNQTIDPSLKGTASQQLLTVENIKELTIDTSLNLNKIN